MQIVGVHSLFYAISSIDEQHVHVMSHYQFTLRLHENFQPTAVYKLKKVIFLAGTHPQGDADMPPKESIKFHNGFIQEHQANGKVGTKRGIDSPGRNNKVNYLQMMYQSIRAVPGGPIPESLQSL